MHYLKYLMAVMVVCYLPVQAARADAYSDAVDSFRNAGESGTYFDGAYGYALFPTVGKGGIVVGGAYGKGRVYVGGKQVGDTTLTAVSVGFQLGGQAFSEIIFFQDESTFKQFTSGNFEFGAEANAVAITAGVSAQANTGGGVSTGASGGRNDATTKTGGYRKGLAIFTVAKGGLMYQVAVTGQKFTYTPVQ